MKITILRKPVTVSFAFTRDGERYIVVDSRLPRAKRIAAIAELKAMAAKGH